MEALVDVGTTRGLAHGVEIQAPKVVLEFRDALEMRPTLAEPLGQSWLGAIDLD
jgi:hypothetical protein